MSPQGLLLSSIVPIVLVSTTVAAASAGAASAAATASTAAGTTVLSDHSVKFLMNLFPNLLSLITISHNYSTQRAGNGTSFVSLYCDIILVNLDLDKCLFSNESDSKVYSIDRRRRLTRIQPASLNNFTGWRGDEEVIEFLYMGDGYRTALRFNPDICNSTCTNPDFCDANCAATECTDCIESVKLIVASCSIAVTVILALVVVACRKRKIWSLWRLLVLICVGSGLLYGTGIARALGSCIWEAWLREFGFSLVYGSMVLKVYRSLVEFRTRKAHRWIVREKDLLLYLSAFIAVVFFYLAAWTVGEADCRTSWHRVTEAGELLFLAYGLHLACQNAADNLLYAGSFLLEGLCVGAGIGLREFGNFEGRDWAEFGVRLGSTTIVLLVVFGEKFYYSWRERRGGKRIEKSVECEVAEIHLDDMEIGDIRTELKRVYTQLEHFRNKTMRKDNPHISKRRGGRKPTHRRFSLQKRGRRNMPSFRYNDDIEDSVCSIEGPSTVSEAGR